MSYVPVIGLELHIQLKTRSKLFSNSSTDFGKTPNSQVSIYDMAFPGTLPRLNKEAVIKAIRMCHALHMDIDHTLYFDRKHYFYSDLPKGYQITQDTHPIGKNGYLVVDDNIIEIERLHLEEDTCKQLHYDDYTLLDYNRAGIPLIEVVTKPVVKSGQIAKKFVEKIRSIVTFLDVSDGRMSEGSLRVDVNVSIKDEENNFSSPKVEIKNINTLSNIESAINYEISRQTKCLEMGEPLKQETRRYDERRKVTISMREKVDSIDYKMLVDTNIVPIRLSEEFIKSAISSSKELAEEKRNRYISMGLNKVDADIITSNVEMSNYFDELIKNGTDIKISANWLIGEVTAVLKKNRIDLSEFPIEPNRLAQLIKLIKCGKINSWRAKEIFLLMLKDKSMPSLLVKEDAILDENEIISIVNKVLDEHPECINDYHHGKDRAYKFITGQVMKLTGGRVNPRLTNDLVLQELQRRK